MSDNAINIVADSHIPFIDRIFDGVGAKVTVLEPSLINADAVRNADALLVRTRTRCNADLLQGSRCSFVGTATIGLDHIDREWCAENGIETANAPGCNAPAVAQYVLRAVAELANRPVSQYTLGIVGVGNIGRAVERWARALGMNVILCDPPRQRAEGGNHWRTLQQIAEEADVITFHTPLTRQGQDATFHLANEAFFNSLRRAPIIINAARGPVVDGKALSAAIDRGLVSHTVLDTWEGEPNIDRALLDKVDIATPHIAGYSREGKVRASRMAVDALCRHFGLPHVALTVPDAPDAPAEVPLPLIIKGYDIMADDAALRRSPETFEALRDYYDLRPEPAPHTPKPSDL